MSLALAGAALRRPCAARYVTVAQVLCSCACLASLSRFPDRMKSGWAAGSIKPGKEKTQAVKEFPAPKSVKEIRRFTGLTNYFRASIPGYAKLAGKLTKLLAKETGWGGGDLPSDALETFMCLREKLTQAPILAFPQSGVPFTLVTDASLEHGYGGVLLQFQNGRNRAIAYFSRGLKAHEKNYSAYLLELGAAAAAIEHFHVYLYGTRFVLMCDHKPMVKLDKIYKRTLLRLQELMGEYDFRWTICPEQRMLLPTHLAELLYAAWIRSPPMWSSLWTTTCSAKRRTKILIAITYYNGYTKTTLDIRGVRLIAN